jgi:glycosyltransferase involved in cell wall biosynthesis
MNIVRYYPRALLGDGGMSGAVRRWSPALVRTGADVTIAYDGTGDVEVRDGVRWVPVPHAGRGALRVPLGLEPVLRGADLLVLHSGWAAHNVRAGQAARRAGVRYVLEPRGAYDPHIVRRRAVVKHLWWAAWERSLVAGAAAIHAFFEEERAHLHAIGYRGPLIVASNGAVAPAGARWDGGSGRYVLWLGRFDPEHKGLDLLVRAVAQLRPDERPIVRLHGPDWRGRKAAVERMVREAGVERWVTVGPPAYGDEKARLLSRAAAFVYPSRWDACPNSVLESVAMGIPTVVTEYPLGRALAAHGAAIGADATPGSLADALRRASGPDAAEVGEKGARYVRERLGWDEVARAWLEQAKALP